MITTKHVYSHDYDENGFINYIGCLKTGQFENPGERGGEIVPRFSEHYSDGAEDSCVTSRTTGKVHSWPSLQCSLLHLLITLGTSPLHFLPFTSSSFTPSLPPLSSNVQLGCYCSTRTDGWISLDFGENKKVRVSHYSLR